MLCRYRWVSIATQLNSTQLTQSNSVQPSEPCFCLWRHDLQTVSTGSLRSLIRWQLSWVELCRYRHFANSTQLNSTSSWVELCRYKHPLSLDIYIRRQNYEDVSMAPGAGRSRTGASSVPAWRRSPTGPVTVVLVADSSMWLVRWLRNCTVQLQTGRGTSRVPVAADRRCWRPEMAVADTQRSLR